jgi:hypothetical protein
MTKTAVLPCWLFAIYGFSIRPSVANAGYWPLVRFVLFFFVIVSLSNQKPPCSGAGEVDGGDGMRHIQSRGGKSHGMAEDVTL